MKTWLVFLVCLNTMACFHSVDGTKVKCTNNDHCPSDFVCNGGKCVGRSAVTGSGGVLGVDASSAADAKAVGFDMAEPRNDVADL